MTVTEPQDALTFIQPLIKEISDKETLNLFMNKNLMNVLGIMRADNIPMTIDEIAETFNKMDNKKSVKTIYRYLNELEHGGLVVQAGKRITRDGKGHKAKTLYLRSAKIFLPIKDESSVECDEIKQRNDLLFKTIALILSQLSNNKVYDPEKLREFSKNVNLSYSKKVRNILINANSELTDLVSKLDWNSIDSLLFYLNDLLLIMDSDILSKKLNET